uniref:Uncharacterized protein n=1 Tax=Rhizophora mucronata TaxID=61149 RepID=A0A2P2NSM1_RHIMU
MIYLCISLNYNRKRKDYLLYSLS